MAKPRGTKHHVVIKLDDLNKMFKGNDVIPVPKGFVKSIEYFLSAHNVSLDEVDKDSSPVAQKETETETVEKVEFQSTDFND